MATMPAHRFRHELQGSSEHPERRHVVLLDEAAIALHVRMEHDG
jgi:hypothetical protein